MMKAHETQAVAYTSACHGLVHILELTYGAVLIGIGREFGSNLFVLGLLANVSGFAFGLTALPFGFLADFISERRLFMVCCFGIATASLAVGLSTNIYMLGTALAILGLALGIYHPVGSSFVAKVATRRGLAFGYLGIGGNLGVALGPILAASIASVISWRAAYIAFAIPAALLGALFYTFARTEMPVVPQPQAQTCRPSAKMGHF